MSSKTRLLSYPDMRRMNPIVISGVVVVAVLSVGLMMTVSERQADQSAVVERMSDMQAMRVQERASVRIRDDGRLEVGNTGGVPITIREVRVLDGGGRVIMAQGVDVRIGPVRTGTVDITDHGITAAIEGIGAGADGQGGGGRR